MALDLTSFAAALKQHYTAERVENMVYMDNPLLAMVEKMENFGGKNLPIPIIYGNPQGRSADFSTAKANKGNSKLKDFVLTRDKDYSLASIDNETLDASKGDSNAFMEAATTEIDGAIHSITRSIAVALFRSGSGSIGQIAATTNVATNTLKLSDVEEVTNFEVGMVLTFSTTDGGGTVEVGSVTIDGVDRDAGTITTDAVLNVAVPTIATGDFIFVEGDYDAKIKGLDAWIPETAPTAGDNFFSVDRSSDATRLGGIRYDGSAEPIEESLVNGASRAGREGAKVDTCFLSYDKFADLENALGSKVQYIEHNQGDIGFRGIMIHGPRGPIKVIPDQNCPNDTAYMLTMSSWKLYSLGKCPKILDSDGLRMLRENDADAVEVRVGYYAQLGCRAPGWNVRVKLA